MNKSIEAAFLAIHNALWREVGWAYETAFAWALLQPGEISEKAKVLAEERWGKEYRRARQNLGFVLEESDGK